MEAPPGTEPCGDRTGKLSVARAAAGRWTPGEDPSNGLPRAIKAACSRAGAVQLHMSSAEAGDPLRRHVEGVVETFLEGVPGPREHLDLHLSELAGFPPQLGW